LSEGSRTRRDNSLASNQGYYTPYNPIPNYAGVQLMPTISKKDLVDRIAEKTQCKRITVKAVMRRVPARYRLCMAVLMEVIWEILENSPLIINRYREMTMALGYTGDSVLNSLSDILMMAMGFILASRSWVWVSVAILLVFEIGMLLWVRDNLTLNIIMLIHPIEAIKTWQMSGHAIP